MEIWVTRHGLTEENRAGVVQGTLPGKLTEHGKEQARLFGQRLALTTFDAIFSSDLARAADSARIIVEYLNNKPQVIYILMQSLMKVCVLALSK